MGRMGFSPPKAYDEERQSGELTDVEAVKKALSGDSDVADWISFYEGLDDSDVADWISFYEGLDDSRKKQIIYTLYELGLLEYDSNRELR